MPHAPLAICIDPHTSLNEHLIALWTDLLAETTRLNIPLRILGSHSHLPLPDTYSSPQDGSTYECQQLVMALHPSGINLKKTTTQLQAFARMLMLFHGDYLTDPCGQLLIFSDKPLHHPFLAFFSDIPRHPSTQVLHISDHNAIDTLLRWFDTPTHLPEYLPLFSNEPAEAVKISPLTTDPFLLALQLNTHPFFEAKKLATDYALTVPPSTPATIAGTYLDLLEAYLKATEDTKSQPPSAASRERKHTLQQLYALKLSQYPQLLKAITKRGGISWLLRSQVSHGPKFTEWVGSGVQSRLLCGLISGYWLSHLNTPQPTAT